MRRERRRARGAVSRRTVLGALAAAPAALGLRPAEATDYTSAAEVFTAIDALEAAVAERLRALAAALPATRAFAGSVLADHERQRAERGRLRRRLRLPAAASPDAARGAVASSPTTAGPAPAATPVEAAAIAAPASGETPDRLSLAPLREVQQALVHAHAEGLPALGDPFVVDRLARHMVELARHLAVIDLWRDAEENVAG
jgi:hypothetical protein